MRRPPPTVLVIAATLVPAACGPASDEPSGDEGTPEHPAPATAEAPSLPDLLETVHERGGGGDLTVLDRLPAPRERLLEPVRNRHDTTLTDTLETLVYPGLQVEVYRVAASGKAMVRSIQVSGRGYRTARGIGPGSTLREVRRVFGEPDSMDAATLVYQLGDDARDPTPPTLSVLVRDERVVRMTWSFYVD